MFTHGPRSGVDLVKKMIKDDLNMSFVMFDHIKRMHDWTTMGAHVYNLFFLSLVDHCFV
jgi:hypothetical protein